MTGLSEGAEFEHQVALNIQSSRTTHTHRHSRAGGNPAFFATGEFFDRFPYMREEKLPAVYIMASRYRGTLYIGVTSALWHRVNDHKNERFKGFTSDHGIKLLVWHEHHHNMEDAIRREKQLKKWNRDWKFRLIEGKNPHWLDLHDDIDTIVSLVEAKKAGFPPARE